MPTHPAETEVFNTSIKTSFASGEGLAMRGIMLDAMQRYYASDTSHAAPQEKKDLIIHFAKDAAHEAKDGVTVLTVFKLDLSPAQKELASRGWENFLKSKAPEQLAGFLDEPALKAAVQSVPAIKNTGARKLMDAASHAAGKGTPKDVAATQEAKDVGHSMAIGQLWELNNTFENLASSHRIMYYEDHGVRQELWNSLGKGIEDAKREIAQRMCANARLPEQDRTTFSCSSHAPKRQPGIGR